MTKVHSNAKNSQFCLASSLKAGACGQKVLPDRSILIRQKLVENGKIENLLNATFWVIFKHCAQVLGLNSF